MLPQVTFRGLSPSAEIVETVVKKAKKLSEIAPQLRGCHVVIEAASRGSQRPLSYRVSLQLSGGTEVERRRPRHVTHENLHVALGDVFKLAHRQLIMRSIRPLHRHPLFERGMICASGAGHVLGKPYSFLPSNSVIARPARSTSSKQRTLIM